MVTWLFIRVFLRCWLAAAQLHSEWPELLLGQELFHCSCSRLNSLSLKESAGWFLNFRWLSFCTGHLHPSGLVLSPVWAGNEPGKVQVTWAESHQEKRLWWQPGKPVGSKSRKGIHSNLLQDPGGCFSCEAGKLFFALPESATFFAKPPGRPGAGGRGRRGEGGETFPVLQIRSYQAQPSFPDSRRVFLFYLAEILTVSAHLIFKISCLSWLLRSYL